MHLSLPVVGNNAIRQIRDAVEDSSKVFIEPSRACFALADKMVVHALDTEYREMKDKYRE